MTAIGPDHVAALRELIATWREKEQALCRQADGQGQTQYAERLAAKADGIGACADALAAIVARADAEAAHPPIDLGEVLEAASERDAIKALLSDRSEPGTYAKVEALLAEVAACQPDGGS